MVYRKPFTPEQRREAVREYASFRGNIRLLRDNFGPRTTGEKSAFEAYRELVRAMKAELLKSDRRVRVHELNNLVRRAQAAMAEYLQVRYFGV
jgi:hypothetical protein